MNFSRTQILQGILLVIGLGFFIWGIIAGDLLKVMQIGTYICLGCIGIG